MAIVKEIDTAGKIDQNTLGHWKALMSEHNNIVERGERMMLQQGRAPNMSWLKFRCLDLFMLQMQSRYLAKLLDDFSSFGERVLRLIQESPASLCWTLGGHVLMERTTWIRLCAQVMTLLHVLGMAKPYSARLLLRPWPDRELLEAAAARARRVFGRFARADTSMPTIHGLLFPVNVRDGPESAATAPRRRVGSRRGEESELPLPAAAAADGSDVREDAACSSFQRTGSPPHAMGARDEGSPLKRSRA